MKQMALRICVICGNPIGKVWGKQKTCSIECRRKNKRRNDDKSNENNPKVRPWRVCAGCGASFRNAKHQRNHKVCSKECSKVFRKEKARLTRHKYQEKHRERERIYSAKIRAVYKAVKQLGLI